MLSLVLGNATVDDYLEVERWPQPGESVFGANFRRDLGGKGANQAVVMARAGLEVRLVAAVGQDEAGAWIAASLMREGLDAASLMRVARPSDRSMIWIGPGAENAIVTTADGAAGVTVDEAEAAAAGLDAGDLLVMQGNLLLEPTRAALAAARARGARTVLNPSPVRAGFEALWPLVDLAVVNRGEARVFGGSTDPAEAGRAMRAAGAGRVVVTLGSEGALLIEEAGIVQAPGRPAAAVDTTGAGDCFAGTLIAAWQLTGRLDAAALATAAAAAAIAVTRPGTCASFPTREEMAALLAMPA